MSNRMIGDYLTSRGRPKRTEHWRRQLRMTWILFLMLYVESDVNYVL